MGVSPDGGTIVNTSETTNMAHFIDAASHEITHNVLVDQRPRVGEFTADGAEVWVSAEIGGTVSVIDNASREVKHKITFAIPGVPDEAIQPVGVRITSDRAKPSSHSARPTGSRWSTRRATRSRTTCWSASASGSSRSRPTRSSSTPPTASPTTSR